MNCLYDCRSPMAHACRFVRYYFEWEWNLFMSVKVRFLVGVLENKRSCGLFVQSMYRYGSAVVTVKVVCT